ncbi:MAG TPA: hypothetical protein VLL47_10700 [Robiginitalea sp.]|nr:hypothetical protein [Robiginitalea sp.]
MSFTPAKNVLIALSCGLNFLVHSQTPSHAQDSPLPSPIDSVAIRWPKAEWFGKGRIALDGYATARYKGGITSSSNKVMVNGRNELMQKMRFRVELQDSATVKFKIQGTKYWTSGYWEEDLDGGLQIVGEALKIPEVFLTSETYVSDDVNIELKDAELSHSLQPEDIWKFHLKRNPSTGAIREELDAYLSNGSRIIVIRGPVKSPNLASFPANREETFYEFIEDDQVIGCAGRRGSVAFFSPHTPTFTRSLLLTVLLGMSM